MDPIQQKCLTHRRVELLENLRPDELLDYLIQGDVITMGEKEEIETKATRRKQVDALLKILPTCGHHAFEVLLTGLEGTAQKYIANDLKMQLDFEKTTVDSSKTETGHPQSQPQSSDWIYTEMCEAMRKRKITEKEFVLIAEKMPPELLQVAIWMGYNKNYVDTLQYNHPHNLSLQAMELFCKWRNREASKATVERFVNILQEAGIPESVYKETILRESRKNVNIVV